MANKFWRNGNSGGRPLLFSFFRFAWLLPIVPLYLFLSALITKGYAVSIEETIALTSNITLPGLQSWFDSDPILMGLFIAGAGIWLISFLIQSSAAIVIKNNNLFINRFGLFRTGFELANIKSIKIYDLGLIGVYYDFKTQANLGFRKFLFLTKPGADNLRKFTYEHGIEIL